MADSTARKKWSRLQGSRVALTAAASVKPTQPRAQDGYDRYLAILQERNRSVYAVSSSKNHIRLKRGTKFTKMTKCYYIFSKGFILAVYLDC